MRPGMGCYRRVLLTICWKYDHLSYFFDNLCCKIASKNSVLVALVLYGVESHVLSPNQSTGQTFL